VTSCLLATVKKNKTKEDSTVYVIILFFLKRVLEYALAFCSSQNITLIFDK